jgi:cyclic-di-GMP-binding protein
MWRRGRRFHRYFREHDSIAPREAADDADVISYYETMAATYSFDVTSNIEMPEVDNAVNQARKEIGQRFDFKGSIAQIDLDQKANTLTLTAEDNFKLESVWDVLQTRLIKRNVPVKNLKRGDIDAAAGSTVKQVITLQQGIPTEAAKEIVKHLKDLKKKVQASIQADQVRVSSASKDELQEAMQALRAKDFGVALQFGNYR